jgi:hypothetical protein
MTDRTASIRAEYRTRRLAMVPVAIVFAACHKLLCFLRPPMHDILTESYEPAKTPRFDRRGHTLQIITLSYLSALVFYLPRYPHRESRVRTVVTELARKASAAGAITATTHNSECKGERKTFYE